MILGRCGNKGNTLFFGSSDDEIYFGSMVVYGFFFHTLLQVISIVLGDKNTVLVSNLMKNVKSKELSNLHM